EPGDPGLAVPFGVLLATAYTDAGLPDAAYQTLDLVEAERDVLSNPIGAARIDGAISRSYAEHGPIDLAERYARRVVSTPRCAAPGHRRQADGQEHLNGRFNRAPGGRPHPERGAARRRVAASPRSAGNCRRAPGARRGSDGTPRRRHRVATSRT